MLKKYIKQCTTTNKNKFTNRLHFESFKKHNKNPKLCKNICISFKSQPNMSKKQNKSLKNYLQIIQMICIFYIHYKNQSPQIRGIRRNHPNQSRPNGCSNSPIAWIPHTINSNNKKPLQAVLKKEKCHFLCNT